MTKGGHGINANYTRSSGKAPSDPIASENKAVGNFTSHMRCRGMAGCNPCHIAIPARLSRGENMRPFQNSGSNPASAKCPSLVNARRNSSRRMTVKES